MAECTATRRSDPARTAQQGGALRLGPRCFADGEEHERRGVVERAHVLHALPLEVLQLRELCDRVRGLVEDAVHTCGPSRYGATCVTKSNASGTVWRLRQCAV